jgi:hypothetical protein
MKHYNCYKICHLSHHGWHGFEEKWKNSLSGTDGGVELPPIVSSSEIKPA